MGKLKLNKDGLKGIFINHVEKMVLGVVLLVFGVFVYSSLGLEGIPSNQTPDALIQSAQNAEKSITNPENAKAVLSTVTASSGYVARAKEGLIPTDPVLYASAKPPTPYWGPDGTKRGDPKLLPPEKPEVYPVVGGVAYWMKSPDDDPLSKLKNAAPKISEEEKRRRKKAEADAMNYGGAFGAGEAESGGGRGSGGMAGMMPGGMMPGGMGMPGGDAGLAGMGAGSPEAAIMANPLDRVGFTPQPNSVAKTASCVVVKFVVPWRKQWEEYQAQFADSLGYNPARDNPNYLSFTAERVDVTADPNGPVDWETAEKSRMWTTQIKDEMLKAGYAGFAQEIADPRYLHLGFLTFPIPPFINRDLEPLAVHAEVPKLATTMAKSLQQQQGKDQGKEKKADPKKDGKDRDLPVDAPGGAFAQGGQGGNAAGGMMPGGGGMMQGGEGMMGGMMPGGEGMMGGMMPGGEGMMGGMMPGGEGMMGGMMPGGSGMMPGGMMPGGMMGGREAESGDSGGNYGMMGMAGMGDATITPGPAVPYMLIRFYDFSAEPGKVYRYRVQTILEDPNHPQFMQMEPSDRYLDDEVKKRLLEVASVESSTKTRRYFLRTEFSEPSAPVSIEIEPKILAGTVPAVKTTSAPDIIPGIKEKMIADEPVAKVMSVMWDSTFATDVTGVTDALRGTLLNFTSTGDAIHPVSLIFKALENYQFRTNRLVADIRGGEELAGIDKEVLLSPGQVAVVNDKGQIIVRTEFADWDDYRKLALPEISSPAMDPGMMMGGGEGDDGGAGMMPGSSMGGRGRGRNP